MAQSYLPWSSAKDSLMGYTSLGSGGQPSTSGATSSGQSSARSSPTVPNRSWLLDLPTRFKLLLFVSLVLFLYFLKNKTPEPPSLHIEEFEVDWWERLASNPVCQVGSNRSNVDPFGSLTIVAPDSSIHAKFIPLGATLAEMWVKGRDGEARDIVLGYDDRVQYASDPNFAYFGSVVGRYANRIRNSTFAIPPQQVISHAPKDTVHRVTPNENGGRDTLHGGKLGYSRSGFCVLRHSKSKLVFGIVDRDGSEGFPGTVSALVKYELKEGGRWLISMQARVKGGETPVMLTSHTYWNLDGYQDSQTALDHTLFVKSSKFIETDGILIPTGEIGKINLGSPMDFNTPNIIGSRIKDTSGLCGTGCTGYDTCFLYDENDGKDVVMELSSKLSGIKLSVRTNQPAAQVYSCNGQNGVTPRKFSQGGPKETYGKYSCVVLEQQGWIDAINNPQWGQDQIYGSAGREVYKWESEYTFTTM